MQTFILTIGFFPFFFFFEGENNGTDSEHVYSVSLIIAAHWNHIVLRSLLKQTGEYVMCRI